MTGRRNMRLPISEDLPDRRSTRRRADRRIRPCSTLRAIDTPTAPRSRELLQTRRRARTAARGSVRSVATTDSIHRPRTRFSRRTPCGWGTVREHVPRRRSRRRWPEVATWSGTRVLEQRTYQDWMAWSGRQVRTRAGSRAHPGQKSFKDLPEQRFWSSHENHERHERDERREKNIILFRVFRGFVFSCLSWSCVVVRYTQRVAAWWRPWRGGTRIE